MGRKNRLFLSCIAALAGANGCDRQAKAPAEPTPAISVAPPSASSDVAPEPHRERAAEEKFSAILRVDAAPSGKKFQGVWLERDDGQRFVIAYRADELWKSFAGARVEVSGERYDPEGQRVMSPHFRVNTLRLLGDENDATFVEVGPEQTLNGQFSDHPHGKGEKLEGVTEIFFTTSDGTNYLIANRLAVGKAPRGSPVEIRARHVAYSRFTQHVGGEHLWLLELVK